MARRKEKEQRNKIENSLAKTGEVIKQTAGKFKHISVGKLIGWGIAMVFIFFIMNPGLIPFLPADIKKSLQEIWKDMFGDVDKLSSSFSITPYAVIRVIAIIIVMTFIATLLKFIFERIRPKTPKTKSILSLAYSATNYLIIFITVFFCLAAIGINLTTVFAGVGVLALIIGFGAQSMVSDLVTGVFVVLEGQFNVGDIIEVGGYRGMVESIGIRTTTVRDIGNNVKIINNSDLRNVLNRSLAESVASTSVSVSYDTDLEKAEVEIAELLPKIKEKYPEIFLAVPEYIGVDNLGESGVELKFIAKVKEQNIYTAPRLLNREIKIHFDKCGIEIPFNQIVVHEAKNDSAKTDEITK